MKIEYVTNSKKKNIIESQTIFLSLQQCFRRRIEVLIEHKQYIQKQTQPWRYEDSSSSFSRNKTSTSFRFCKWE